MAILKTEQGEIRVRIKRYSGDTYYDEYISVECKKKDSSRRRERYIISEPGTMYYIEVTLKNGFYFGEYEGIDANLSFPSCTETISRTSFRKPTSGSKIKDDISGKIKYADVEVGGKEMFGAKSAFRALEVDELLFNETDIMGVDPESLVTFSVSLSFLTIKSIRLSDDEYDEILLLNCKKYFPLAPFRMRSPPKLNPKKTKPKGKANKSDTRNL